MNIGANKPIQLAVIAVVLAGALYVSITDIESNSETETVELPTDRQTGSSDTNNNVSQNTTEASEATSSEGKSSDSQTKSVEQIIEEKDSKYKRARPLRQETGYVNTDGVSIEDNIGDKVILLDMWTYSCINCQRTLPHIQEWHEKYSDDGLLVIGNHAPEFEFEKKRSNVKDAAERFNLTYPIVLDNQYGTWDAYNNRYWPQKYLIGVDGFIRYEHIGEGSYNETEQKIRELLKERNERLGIDKPIDDDGVRERSSDNPNVNFTKIKTPEIYFGAWRNNKLENGVQNEQRVQTFSAPETLKEDKLYLDGEWDIKEKRAVGSEGDSILLNYEAKNVNMVLDGQNTTVRVYHDGEPVSESSGESVEDSEFVVNGEQLYKLIENQDYERHKLRVEVVEGTLDAYTFTFG